MADPRPAREPVRADLRGRADQGALRHLSPRLQGQLLAGGHDRSGTGAILHGAKAVQERILPLHHRGGGRNCILTPRHDLLCPKKGN